MSFTFHMVQGLLYHIKPTDFENMQMEPFVAQISIDSFCELSKGAIVRCIISNCHKPHILSKCIVMGQNKPVYFISGRKIREPLLDHVQNHC